MVGENRKSKRMRKILDILSQEGTVKTEELSSKVGASITTLRRDLSVLQRLGYIVKGYGFVTLLGGNPAENGSFMKRLSMNREEKEKIAMKAINYVNEGDVIFLDESTTCYVFAQALVRRFKKLHIITNAIHTLLVLAQSPGFLVESTGGSLLSHFDSLVGPKAESNLKGIYAQKFFFSCKALKQDEGTFELNPFSASIKRIMLANSEENYLLVDHTKIGSVSPFFCIDISDIRHVITDKEGVA